jgi:suppressor of G2 allele of SKP1
MEFAAKGAVALKDNDHRAAVAFYTHALVQHPSSPDYFVQRSLAFARLEPRRYDLALRDAEYACLLGQKRAKREKIQAAQHRRVVALYGLGRYADANFILQTMEKWVPQGSKPAKMEADMWKVKITNKLKTMPKEAQVVTETEYPQIELPSEAKMKEWLQSQLKAEGSFKFDEDAEMNDAPLESALTASTVLERSDAKTSATSKPALSASTTVRHEWYQSAQSVTVTLYAKGVSKTECEIDIKEDSVHVSFPNPLGQHSEYSFNIDPLFALIDPTQSKGAVLSTKIELTLKKAQSGQKWHDLEGSAPLKVQAQTLESNGDDALKAAVMSDVQKASSTTLTTDAPNKAPSYPTSSRNGPKDWDRVAKDLTSKTVASEKKSKKVDKNKKGETDSEPEQAEDEDSDYGGDAVDGFFKKLYAGADPDTRRAMMKSYYESNGTALSTNWKDVGSKKVEEVKSSKD